MFRSILVSVDGSSASERIAWHVKRLTLSEPEVRVLLLRVLRPDETTADVQLDVRRQLLRMEQLLSGAGVTTSSRLVSGDLAEEVLAAAMELGPDLLAMTTHGSDCDSGVCSHAANEVLRGAPCPVLLVNPWRATRIPDLGFARILVPIHRASQLEDVLPFTAELARQQEAAVLLLSVRGGTVEPAGMGARRRGGDSEADVGELLEQARRQLAAQGIATEVSGCLGQPSDVILATARSEQADLLILGTEGCSDADRCHFAGVAERVVDQCELPILVHRPSEQVCTRLRPREAANSSR